MSDQTIRAAIDGMRTLMRFMKADAPARRVQVFLHVAMFGPSALDEVSRNVKAAPGTVYDDLRALGETDSRGKAGRRLVKEIASSIGGPHSYVITSRGQMAVDALEFQMTAAMLDDDDMEAA